jgi:hypothetical protein
LALAAKQQLLRDFLYLFSLLGIEITMEKYLSKASLSGYQM